MYNQEIHGILNKIKEEHNIKIIYACLAGSHAFGYAGPDSDIDVRLIFKYHQEKYLSLFNPPDVKTFGPYEIDGKKVDITGWDIKKAFHLGMKSNQHLLEYLHSPQVYREVCTLKFFDPSSEARYFKEELLSVCQSYFNPIKVRRAYVSIFRNKLECIADESYTSSPMERLKLLLSGLHSLLIGEYVYLTGKFPESVDIKYFALSNNEPRVKELIEMRKSGKVDSIAVDRFIEDSDSYTKELAQKIWGVEDWELESSVSKEAMSKDQCDEIFRRYLK